MMMSNPPPPPDAPAFYSNGGHDMPAGAGGGLHYPVPDPTNQLSFPEPQQGFYYSGGMNNQPPPPYPPGPPGPGGVPASALPYPL